MKFAIQTNVWNPEYHQNLPELLDEIKLAGYDGLEIGAHRLDLSLPGAFAEMLSTHQVSISGLHIHGELHNPTSVEPLYDFYAQAVKFSAAVGAPFMLISGKPKQNGKTVQELAAEIQVLKRVSEICANHGISLCYHNHYWELEQELRELDHLISRTNSNDFGLALDVAWVYRAGYQPALVIQRYQDRIKYLHLKDTLHDRFTDLGQGQVDFLAIKDAIREIPLPWLTVERDEVLPNAGQSARACREYLRDLFA
jgi:inosose dehydratase